MRARHASSDMVQIPSSPSTLIGDDMPTDTYFERKLPSPFKQRYNSQVSGTASLQVPARVTEKAPFLSTDALRVARERRQRDTSKQLQKLLDDGRRRARQVLMDKPGTLCNIINLKWRHLGRSMVHNQDTHDLGTSAGGGKINQLSDGNSLEKKAAVGAVQEKGDSGDIKASLNTNGHRPKKLIVNLPLTAPLGGKRPLPQYDVEEGDKDMAGATRAINPQKKRRLAAPPAQKKMLKLRLGGRTSRA